MSENVKIKFDNEDLAEKALKDCGFSLGTLQRDAARGILHGNYDIAKWRNLPQDDIHRLHGAYRRQRCDGSVLIWMKPSCPAKALAHLTKLSAMQHTLVIDPRFADAIRDGDKRQTIISQDEYAASFGYRDTTVKLIMFGARPPEVTLLGIANLSHIDEVVINSTDMSINGKALPICIYDRYTSQTDREFAQCEGFKGFTEMRAWVQDKYVGMGETFYGVVIHWTELYT